MLVSAVYGSPDHSNPIKEDDEKNPISPYGASKLAAEGEINKFLVTPGNHGTSLRFFNVVGTAAPELMDNSVENLVPIVINKLKAGQAPVIYGTDYPTPDGTCVRDYVDVRDIARAHLVAADSTETLPLAMNVGTGCGGSVREVIKLVCAAAGRNDVVACEAERRAGDPAFLCAEVSLIKSGLKFSSNYLLKASIESLF
jgi:UDP-glucose 4-epimerase